MVLILAILFHLFPPSSASSGIYLEVENKKEVPLELDLYLKNFLPKSQIPETLSNDEANTFKTLIKGLKTLNYEMSKISNDKTIFFLSKEQLYKAILEESSNIPQSPNVPFSLEKFITKEKFRAKISGLDDFSKWYLESIYLNAENIYEKNQLQFMSQSKTKKGKSTYKNINKKLSLLLSWIALVKFNSAEELFFYTNQLKVKILPNLINALKTYNTLNPQDSSSKSTNSDYFKIVKKKFETQESKKDLLQILSKSINSIEKKDFTDEDFISKLPPFPTPDPYYGAPDMLPSSVDDWQKEVEIIMNPFPKPSENYVLPTNLPSPINDWNFNI